MTHFLNLLDTNDEVFILTILLMAELVVITVTLLGGEE